MLPIRFPPFALARCLIGLAFVFELGAVAFAPVQAGPLPPLGVDEFRILIDSKRSPRPRPAEAGRTLTEYRRRLHEAAKELPSLGEVARVLLMSEWSGDELYSSALFGSSVPLDQVRKAVEKTKDEDFQGAVRKLMADRPDDWRDIDQAIVSEIKRQVRLELLDRLVSRIRYYLNQGHTADRIATANLVGDTLTTSRRQDVSLYRPNPKEDPGLAIPGVMATTPEKDKTERIRTETAKNLRQRLGSLSGDLEKLLSDPDTRVRVAGIRALSDLEKEPGQLVALLKPLLVSPQSDAPTRQAVAEALGHAIEVSTSEMEKSRPLPYLNSVDKILPVAAEGLTDSNPRVRRASLEACQQAAVVLETLANDPLASQRRIVFRPTLLVVDSVLPKLNECARDSIPELRVGACHVLETLALSYQKLRRTREEILPLPSLDLEPYPPTPPPSKDSDSDKKKGASQSPRTSPSATSVGTAILCSRQIDELPPLSPTNPGIQGAVQTMIGNLKHPDYRVRLASVDTLETFRNQAEAAIPALVEALRDYNKFVRWSAARTLGRLSPRRPDEVVPGLMRMLDDREDPSVRIAAASALELYGEHAKKAVPLLARVINRGDKEYIVAILHTIQGIGTDAAPALPNVAWILSDRLQPPSVRIEAAQTLGRFGALAKKQLSVLLDVMNNDPDEDVRNAASIAVLAVDRP